MNSAERIDAVIRLEVPDRVPLAPLLDHFAATYAGTSHHELMYDPDKRIAAILKTMEELGPWDMTYLADTANGPLLEAGIPLKMMRPGYELPPGEIHQFIEEPVMEVSDYDRVLEVGFRQFREELLLRITPDMEDRRAALMEALKAMPVHKKAVEDAGAVVAFSGFIPAPCDFFSYARSFSQFCYDLYDYPDKILAVLDPCTTHFLEMAKGIVAASGVKRVFVGATRCSPIGMTPKQFEMFALPFLEKIIDDLSGAGITTLLHFDNDWTPFLHYFKRFPRGTCILELDGDTDIFKAKEILGDSMCIMGDVPATLLAFGEPDEVRAYCKKLIEIVGEGGGFILSSGCSIPSNAKSQNVKAMREAVDEYGYY
jgi:uroporphyrinogen-III decarboxylase